MIVTPKYYYTKLASEPEALWYEACQKIFGEVRILRTHADCMENPLLVHKGKAIAEKHSDCWRPLQDGQVFQDFEIFDAILSNDRSYPVEQCGVLSSRPGCLNHTAYFYENRGIAPEKQMASNRRYHYLKNLRRSEATFRVGNQVPDSWVYDLIKGRLFCPNFDDVFYLAHQAVEFARLNTELRAFPKVVLQDQNGGFSIWVKLIDQWFYFLLYQPPGRSLGRRHVDEFIRNHLPLGETVLLHVEYLFEPSNYAHYKKDAANLKIPVHHLYACHLSDQGDPPYIDLDTDQVVTDET